MIAFLAALAAPAQAADVSRRAVVVGVNDGGAGLVPLKYAEDDAHRVADVLQQLGGFATEDVVVLLSPDAAALVSALESLTFDEADERMLVFYYSGHADSAGLRLGTETFGWEDLKATIRDVDATVKLGVLDACRAGAITRTKGASVAEPFLVQRALEAEGEAWIAASSDDEQAQESDLVGASTFTHFFLSGLRGAADTGDGKVSLSEAYFYAEDRTVARTAGSEAGAQHPAYQFQISGNGDLVLTDLADADARLNFPIDPLPAEITVLSDPIGSTLADVVLVPGRATALAIPPGRYRLLRHDATGLSEARIFVDSGATLTVDRWGIARATPATEKGGEATERNPWISLTTTDDRLRFELDLPDEIRLPHIDLGRKPGIAVPLSGIVPGAGQAYAGRWGDAAAFFTAFTVVSGIGWTGAALEMSAPAGELAMVGPNPLTTAGFFVWGWSMFDAGRALSPDAPTHGPSRGTTIAYEASWAESFWVPTASGITVDTWFFTWLGAGLDRTGWVTVGGQGMAHSGARLLVGPQYKRVQPLMYGAVGFQVPTDTAAPTLAPTLAVAAAARFYATPRWFVTYDARVSWVHAGDGFGAPTVHHGVSLGTKILDRSRAGAEPPP